MRSPCPWATPWPPLASSHRILGCWYIQTISLTGPFLHPCQSLDLGESLCPQVAIIGAQLLPPPWQGLERGPHLFLSSWYLPFLLWLCQLCHTMYVFMHLWRQRTGTCPARSAEDWRGWGDGVLFTVRAFGKLSSLSILTHPYHHPSTHTQALGASEAHPAEDDLKNSLNLSPPNCTDTAAALERPEGVPAAVGEGARWTTYPLPPAGRRELQSMCFGFW